MRQSPPILPIASNSQDSVALASISPSRPHTIFGKLYTGNTPRSPVCRSPENPQHHHEASHFCGAFLLASPIGGWPVSHSGMTRERPAQCFAACVADVVSAMPAAEGLAGCAAEFSASTHQSASHHLRGRTPFRRRCFFHKPREASIPEGMWCFPPPSGEHHVLRVPSPGQGQPASRRHRPPGSALDRQTPSPCAC